MQGDNLTPEEREIAILALGRIFRLGSRPYQEGDIEEYERCRKIIMDLTDPITDYRPNYARDQAHGAQGD